jgi:hypothetical protein
MSFRLSSGIFSIDVGLDPSINQYQSGVLASRFRPAKDEALQEPT